MQVAEDLEVCAPALAPTLAHRRPPHHRHEVSPSTDEVVDIEGYQAIRLCHWHAVNVEGQGQN
eukprot:10067617-Alexandrium_andersonii.AAC.1